MPQAGPDAKGAAPVGPVGVMLPTYPQESDVLPGARDLAKFCESAEAAGAGALWACDHIFWHRPLLECFTTLSVAAAATSRAAIGPCVLQLPMRNPTVVAKEAASLQLLSGGRLVLGVGVGSHPGEYEAVGAEFHGRAKTLDIAIAHLRQLWEDPDHDQRSDERYSQIPRPSRIPVWVGGSSEAALRRAARLGDGWIPLFVEPPDYSQAMVRLDKEAERAGRDSGSIQRAITVFVSLGSDKASALEKGARWMSSLYALPPKAFARHLVAGPASAVASSIERFYEAGASHVVLFFTCDHPLVQFEDLAVRLGAR